MAALLAGADSFECENAGLPKHQRIGASEPTQSKKYASLVLVTMVLGAAGGIMGFYVVGPSMSENGTSQGFMFASEGHGMGKAMAKAYVADIGQTVDRMDNKELGALFSNMEHDMCDGSVMPQVDLMLRDPRTTAHLDALLNDPNFPEEVKELAEQSLTQGSLNPLKALGKFIPIPGIGLTHQSAAPTAGSAEMMIPKHLASRAGSSEMLFGRKKAEDKKVEKIDDPEEDLSENAITLGAGAVGGLVGLQLFHDTTPAVILCLLAAYGTTVSDGWGDSARTAGEVAVKVAKGSQKLNDKYELTGKLKEVADLGFAGAKDLDEERGISASIKEKLNLDENVDKVTSKLDDLKDAFKNPEGRAKKIEAKSKGKSKDKSKKGWTFR